MGNLAYILSVSTLSVALVAWAAASRRLAPAARGAAAALAIAIGCLPWILAADRRDERRRQIGLAPAVDEDSRRDPPRAVNRGTRTPVPAPAPAAEAPKPAAAAPVAEAPKRLRRQPPRRSRRRSRPDPRNGPASADPIATASFTACGIATDWSQSPPVQLWRRPIGPGWSSFAVNGDLLYTQEQRGDDEIVSCYRLTTGEPVWRHRDAARFWESNGGAGPRGTPTLEQRPRLHVRRDRHPQRARRRHRRGRLVAQRRGRHRHGKSPMWGFSSSPLVVGDVVIVAAARQARRLRRRDRRRRDGSARRAAASYSSPQLATIDGVEQVCC